MVPENVTVKTMSRLHDSNAIFTVEIVAAKDLIISVMLN